MERQIKIHLSRFRKWGLTPKELVIEIYNIGSDNKMFPKYLKEVEKALKKMVNVEVDEKKIYYIKK